MKGKVDIDFLQKKAKELRKEILEIITEAKSGHPGGSLSCVEIIMSLYYYKMRHNPENPKWEERDRFILSKGHACPTLYAVLADLGYFPKEELHTLRKLGARLQGHAYIGVPGVELSTGSLGHGLSFANGMALGGRLKNENFNVYCLLGDGEMQEGSVWEAGMTAAHYNLDNVCAILDYNGVQENGPIGEIMNEEPLKNKWESFGWHVIEVDGHNFNEIISALDEFESVKGKPTIIIAHTIKGKGVSFMEGKAKWHGKAPKKEELELALKELGF